MIIQHNMQAANANRMLGTIVTSQSKSTEKLSSGYRINRAGDDAAGLAISEKMRGQIRGLNKASDNAQDGISMIQTAEGALTETHSIIQRMRELAVQAANDTNTDDDRTQIQNEIDQLTQEVDRIATTTEFNTKKLLDGSRQGSVNEKAGSANVDSTFANSNVSASITTDGSAKAAFSDVIRIEITQDFVAGQSTASTGNYSAAELDAAVKAIKGATGYVATNSLEKNLSNALEKLTPDLDTKKATATTSAEAVSGNEALIDKIVDAVVKADAEVGADTPGASLFAAGKTAEDLKEALKNAVDAYTTAAAGGNNSSITSVKQTITNILTPDAATLTKNTVGVPTFEGTIKDDGTTNTKKTVTGNTNIQTLAESIVDALDGIALEMSATKKTDTTNQADVATVQKNVDILSNKNLITAKVELDEANSALATARGTNIKSDIDIAQAQVDAAQAKLDSVNAGKSVLTVTDLFGNGADTNAFKIGDAVNEDNELTITLKNKSGDDTVITISNADKLKAGDVITVTSQAMVESKQAATGKEAFRVQVGANAGQEVALGINSMKAKDLNIVQTKDGVEGESLDVTNQANASLAVKAFDMAIQKVSTERAKMGATQNRLEHTIANLDTSSENLQSAESRIRDVDMAEEMVTYSKNSILQQAAQSMLAQANQSTQGVLSLLQ